MKKFSVFLLVLILLFSMSTLAFAADDTSSETETVSDPAQDFMNSLNDGTIEDAKSVIDNSMNDLPSLSTPVDFVAFLAAGLDWIPADIWTVITLNFVLVFCYIIKAFLWG